MNFLYNSCDGTILLSNAEGWGLALTESLLAGTPIIANVTGGMQDQMRFVDENGRLVYYHNSEVPSNHRGTYKEHGEWALPVYPQVRTMVGSLPTPYIFDDRLFIWEDAADRIMEFYNLSKEERKSRGLAGKNGLKVDEAGFYSRSNGRKDN